MGDSVGAANASTKKASSSDSSKTENSPLSSRSSDAVTAYTILRLSFGANILFHGVTRLIAGHAPFLAYLNHYFERTPLIPAITLPAFAFVLRWVEAILGLMLFLGLGTRFSLIAGGLVMTCLVIGTNLAQDWNVAGLQLIYCFIYYYLLARLDLNRVSLDAWRAKGR